jgi:hypothetical protein
MLGYRIKGQLGDVYYNDPPYEGPFDPTVFDSDVYATLANLREDYLYYCRVCRRPVVIDNRTGRRHPHFNWSEKGDVLL